ncbi:hypothetical protein [Anaerosinus sp.]
MKDKGKVSRKVADNKAKVEYNYFNKTKEIISDFDCEVKMLLQKGKS